MTGKNADVVIVEVIPELLLFPILICRQSEETVNA
jgi:hypothetical protein